MLRIRYGDRDLQLAVRDVILHLVYLADGQATADLGALAGGVGVLVPKLQLGIPFAL